MKRLLIIIFNVFLVFNCFAAEMNPNQNIVRKKDYGLMRNIDHGLMVEVRNGNLDKVKAYIKNGANVNAVDCSGNSTVLTAAKTPEIVQTLLDAGADPNFQNRHDSTALMHFAQSRDDKSNDILKLLLKANANPNIQSDRGWTALMVASNNGKEKNIQTLLDAGADADIESNGETALVKVVRFNTDKFAPIVQMLLNAPINNIVIRNKSIKKALDEARERLAKWVELQQRNNAPDFLVDQQVQEKTDVVTVLENYIREHQEEQIDILPQAPGGPRS